MSKKSLLRYAGLPLCISVSCILASSSPTAASPSATFYQCLRYMPASRHRAALCIARHIYPELLKHEIYELLKCLMYSRSAKMCLDPASVGTPKATTE